MSPSIFVNEINWCKRTIKINQRRANVHIHMDVMLGAESDNQGQTFEQPYVPGKDVIG